ncbi:MAG: glycosyltransferase family 2 protein, partial [Patescibacteria group bacterium]
MLREDLKNQIKVLKGVMARAGNQDFRKITHLILLPTVRESVEVLTSSIKSYLACDYPADKMVLVLACEERAGEYGLRVAAEIKSRFEKSFSKLLVTFHPDGIAGEAKTKGANITYAAKEAKKILDESGVDYKDVIVSAFDADSVVTPQYFAQLTYAYLTCESPTRTSYQPVPIYNNNIWDAPAFNRLVAINSSFWQMVESSRPDRLITFSSHSMSMQALVEVDYWPVDVISEDSQIFWRCFLHYHGDYRTVPLFTFVSLDAVVLESYLKSLAGQYKQNRRWAWGVVDWPYVVDGFRKDPKIPLWKKLLYAERLLEGHYFWATAALMIAALGWLPLFLGGARLANRVLAVNLPQVTGTIMTISTIFLILFVALFFILLPKRPHHRSALDNVWMLLQWLLVPVSSIFFGGFPAIDAQTRLMFGKYMEFWVTPKVRK